MGAFADPNGELFAGESSGWTLLIESAPSGARVFVRTGGPNGYEEVGVTPLTLTGAKPGLLEYTLFHEGWQLHDGRVWMAAGERHAEKVELNRGKTFYVAVEGSDDLPCVGGHQAVKIVASIF